jgi:hypothetical protein
MRNEADVAAIDNAQAKQAAQARLLGAIQQGASAAKDLGSAHADFAAAQPVAEAA